MAKAVETLGGSPARLWRGPSPGWRLPDPLRRRVEAFDAGVDALFDRLRGRHPAVDRVFYAASDLGDFSLIWHLLGVTKGLSCDDTRPAARLSAALAVESVVVNGVVKSLFRRTRPPWDVQRPLRLRRPSTSSFPSGHATSGFLAATLLSDRDPRWRFTYLVAAVVASSRVHVRIHHASDVVAGAGIGLLAGQIIKRVAPLHRR